MSEPRNVSRRDFVSAAVSVAAVSFLPAHGALATLAAKRSGAAATSAAAAQGQVTLAANPDWKDQGIVNLAHSPFAKLKNVPVHAVLGQAPRDQRDQEHPVDGKTPAHQRASR